MRELLRRLNFWLGRAIASILPVPPTHLVSDDVADALDADLMERWLRGDLRPLLPFVERLEIARRRAAELKRQQRKGRR